MLEIWDKPALINSWPVTENGGADMWSEVWLYIREEMLVVYTDKRMES